MIRADLLTAIQSDLPGNVSAITREDVWSFDGRRVLIPAGTKLIGDYRSGITRGQTRFSSSGPGCCETMACRFN